MIGLRIFGAVIGLSLIVWSWTQLNRRSIRLYHFLTVLFICIGLIVIALFPDSVFILSKAFSVGEEQYGRIVSVLISSNFLLWLIIVYLRQGITKNESNLSKLISTIGIEEFKNEYGQVKFEEVTVVIPAHNEDENLELLFKELNNKDLSVNFSTLIVDDGSFNKIERSRIPDSCYLATNKINRGGGNALRLGFRIAQEAGASVIVTMDADNQHNPVFIPKLIEPILNNQADIVIGSRIKGENQDVNPVRLAGIYFYNFIINLLIRGRVTDCSSGYRAIRTANLSALHLVESQYHTSEFIIEASRKDMRIVEVPIVMKPRAYGETKKGGTLKYGFSFFRVIIQTLFRDK